MADITNFDPYSLVYSARGVKGISAQQWFLIYIATMGPEASLKVKDIADAYRRWKKQQGIYAPGSSMPFYNYKGCFYGARATHKKFYRGAYADLITWEKDRISINAKGTEYAATLLADYDRLGRSEKKSPPGGDFRSKTKINDAIKVNTIGQLREQLYYGKTPSGENYSSKSRRGYNNEEFSIKSGTPFIYLGCTKSPRKGKVWFFDKILHHRYIAVIFVNGKIIHVPFDQRILSLSGLEKLK